MRYNTATLKFNKIILTRAAALVLCCACISCAHAIRDDEIIENREGKLPLALRFPAGCMVSGLDEARAIEQANPKSLCQLWSLARYYHVASEADGHVQKAIEWYGVINNSGRDALADNNTACIHADMGNFDESEKLLRSIVISDSAIITAFYNLYIILKHAGKTEDAVKTLMLMRERYPENIYARIEIGDIFFEKENYSVAEIFYGEALKADRNNPVPIFKMARLKDKAGAYDEAEYYYELCIEKFPYFHYAYLDYSNMLITINKHKKAKTILNKWLDIMNENKAR